MYLSHLKINKLNESAFSDVSNPYQMHKRLCKGFINWQLINRLLFRIEADCSDMNNCIADVIVQNTDIKPDWSFFSAIDDYLLEAEIMEHSNVIYDPKCLYTFKLFANPTIKRNNKRIGLLNTDEQMTWIERKALRGGFDIVSCITESCKLGNGIIPRKSDDGISKYTKIEIPHLMVKFYGILKINNLELFKSTIKNGIGPAKSFGMGLLTVDKI